MDTPQVYLTRTEAAQYLRISPVSLWKQRKSGRLQAMKVGGKILFTRRDLDKLAQLNREGHVTAK